MTPNLSIFPQRIFLDSSILQTLHCYGGFVYEHEPLISTDRIYRDPQGQAKLEALRSIMDIAERAHFEFALSPNSFAEVEKAKDHRYLQWAYDVLDHWLICLAESEEQGASPQVLSAFDSESLGYLGAGDKALLKDAVQVDCDTFLTMENKLPMNAGHLQKLLGIRVVSPIGMQKLMAPWMALYL